MSQISVETVTSSAILGEGPHWDSTENVLYYVDIIGKEVRKYDPATKRETIAKLDGDSVSFIIPVEGKHNEFLIGHGHHVCLMTWDGESDKPQKIEKLVAVDEEDYNATNSLNDGKADASGRLWAGTLGDFDSFSKGPKGSLYSFPKIRNASKHVREITCSNGLAWSRDNKVFYYIDTWTHKVDAFDFDIKNGVISNRRTVFDFSANGIKGLPDGMTIDTNDKLWVACFSGSQVIQIDPENGKVLRSIPIPSPQVTSVAFGGRNLDELYVTSGAMNMTPEDKAKYPLAGCTYLIKGIDAKGLPMNSVKL
ncbi:hypothetical protein R5R35_006032 [Gryllus longicercus]|uniref:Regucalcin n=1 Tax=Gryllus longicercus TaxID=2509291 RepID=A0AAN9Z711_9ORTH